MQEHRVRKLGGYVLRRMLGHGAMGTVYLAEDEVHHRPVAVKVLSPTSAGNGNYAASFLSEARIASQINHPNIVSVYDYGRENGHYYLAMEYVDGQSCKAKIIRDGRIPWREAIGIAVQVAGGLKAAAEQGIIHRDIKPENILLDSSGRVRITDLGLAKDVNVITPLPSDTSLGTPDYMSPEQVNNSETVDFRSDIYSLGATLFHMICGKAPYTGRSAYEVMVKHVYSSLPSPLKYVSDLPLEVYDVLRKMMAGAPEARYQSYDELIADLEALLAGQPVRAREFADESMLGTNGVDDSRVEECGRRKKLVWVAIVAASVLCGVGLLVYFLVVH
jgi:serine/threonine-protein kinase